MKDDVRRHLDGDLPLSDLAEESRKEAESWKRLTAAFKVELPTSSMPSWLEDRVMHEIESLPEPGLARKWIAWAARPRPVRVSPLSLGLAAAAVATLFFFRGALLDLPGPITQPGSPETVAAGSTGAPVQVYVQFSLDAPGASSVAVTGDFDDWKGTHGLVDPDGDGVWTGRVPVRPGVHAYMFLVDGSTWLTDPRAERYTDDGFGNRNAVLAVAVPAT
jgi:hypothetical protein